MKQKLKKVVKLLIKKLVSVSRTRIILFAFAALIFIGATLLSLPIASRSGEPTPFINALFTAASASCVTGLTVYDTYTHWSGFGQIVILCLVQIGGLGLMSMAALFSLILKRTITFKERLLMTESLNQNDMAGIVRMTKHILIGTFTIEIIGALILWIRFIPEFGIQGGLIKGIFHSVSAFCNAGIDLMGEVKPFASLDHYVGDPTIIITVSVLIVLGSLGFFVWEDVMKCKFKFSKLRLHTKISLTITGALILIGAILLFAWEYGNSNSHGALPIHVQILSSFFHSISARTAGYTSISVEKMTVASQFIYLIMMFIGGSPGSTAGGIKTVTFGALLFAAFSVARGRDRVEVFGRSIGKGAVLRAVTILLMGLGVVSAGIILVSIFNPELSFMELCVEVVSAFGTVGISLGVTPELSVGSKIVLIFLMYFGRVGILSVALGLMVRMNRADSVKYSYPEEKIMIG